MKKLSEISNDTLLCIDNIDGYVMSKEDFLQSSYYLDLEPSERIDVYIAKKEVVEFDLGEWIERLGEDSSYEGWVDDVVNNLAELPETQAFLDVMKKIMENYPIYWDGEKVDLSEVQDE